MHALSNDIMILGLSPNVKVKLLLPFLRSRKHFER